ncbi:unnamed protein product, partial [Ectocarpus sp. 12 AP-2014]
MRKVSCRDSSLACSTRRAGDLFRQPLRQREGGSSIYPVGEAPLKDIVTDYASLTGSNKWLLASIMLLVFRPVLHSAASL